MCERGVIARDDALTARVRIAVLYETTPAMLHAADSDFRIFAVSDTWLAKLGYQHDAVVGQQSLECMSERSPEHARTIAVPEFLRTGHCADVEFQLVHKDSTLIDVSWSATLDHDSTGKPPGIVPVIQDITARKLADRRLLASRARLTRLIEVTNAGIWEWALLTGETRYNARWADMLGYQLSELEPTTAAPATWLTHIHPDDLPRSQSL